MYVTDDAGTIDAGSRNGAARGFQIAGSSSQLAGRRSRIPGRHGIHVRASYRFGMQRWGKLHCLIENHQGRRMRPRWRESRRNVGRGEDSAHALDPKEQNAKKEKDNWQPLIGWRKIVR